MMENAMMENAIENANVALFCKTGSSMKDFSRFEKFRILPSSNSEKKFSELFLFIFQYKH